jgi:hypothetical protein
MKGLMGIDEYGKVVPEEELLSHDYEILLIAEGRNALGKEVRLRGEKELMFFYPAELSSSRSKFNVVVGAFDHGRLLYDVRVSQRGLLGDLVAPEIVKTCLGHWGWNFSKDDYLVLKNNEGDCVYVRGEDVVPLSRLQGLLIESPK